MTLLTGKNGPNKYNLSGKDNKYISQIPYEINKLKVCHFRFVYIAAVI